MNMNLNNTNDKSKEEKKLIILFTSNFQGGILQFTMQLSSTLYFLGYKVVVFVPDNASFMQINNDSVLIKKYKRYKSISLRNKASKRIADDIQKLNPELVMFCDATVTSTQVLLSLKNNISTSMYIHDVLPHPVKFNLYKQSMKIFRNILQKQALKVVDQIILLSKNSFALFQDLYPSYINKATWMPLGAHVPEVDPQRPLEFGEMINSRYYLFFGRFSKYKGIKRLLRAYNSLTIQEKPMLVIAGSGKLESEEEEIIKNDSNIVLINRYIKDEEMLYLISKSMTVVLPYIEASQSGVIPIAYYFGIPVITSNVPGLVEYVEEDVSGIICSNKTEMTNALLKICDKKLHKHLTEGANRFYKDRLNWSTNLNKCIDLIINKV